MLKNKHFIVALLVAPILAVISYFAVDYMVTERPQPAKTGMAYRLVAMPNCRYASGVCGFKNGDFEVELRLANISDDNVVFSLVSNFPLRGAKFSLASSENKFVAPLAMLQESQDRKSWTLETNAEFSETSLVRLVVASGGSRYFAETGVEFINYETSYHKDFRK